MKYLAAALLLPTCLAAQPSAAPAFEAASIKPSPPDARGSGSNFYPGMVRFNNQPMRYLIRLAYGLTDAQVVGGPNWLDSERFDVVAKASFQANSHPSSANLLAMLQTLVAERCKLVSHREKRSLAGYALLVAKGGIKMETADAASSNSESQRGRLSAHGFTMAALAERLTAFLGLPVEDATKTDGGFDFTLTWTSEGAAASNELGERPGPPDIFIALQEQLGLKLQPKNVQTEILVIDRIEKPSEN